MLTNFHTHTTICDGKDTPEEMVKVAIEKGFSVLGFSEHGYTDFDLRYCMKDMPSYINEIKRLKEKYRNKIDIYLGVEEDAGYPLNREDFDYILGSSHYVIKDGKYYPVDSGYEWFRDAFALWDNNPVSFAEEYYGRFCDYILKRKPDIVGHFDLLTKYDELDESVFLNNPEYNSVAEKYMLKALKSGCIFEVNTGAIARQVRKTMYPAKNLLYIICKNEGRVILSSDCHDAQKLDCYFAEARAILKDIGFKQINVTLNKTEKL